MYRILVHGLVVSQWEIHKQWWRDPTEDLFNVWVEETHPEVYGCEYDDESRQFEFLFESEAHYHWFLLKQ